MRSDNRSQPAALVRHEREAAARRYRPDIIELLLVAEAPPAADDRYFYFETVRQHDSLFREVAKAILGDKPGRDNKAAFLSRLKTKGVFMIDLKLDPVDGTELKACVPDLIARCRDLEPEKIILIKATVFDVAYSYLRDAGLPVIDVRLPFPGSGKQGEFQAGMRKALSLVSLA